MSAFIAFLRGALSALVPYALIEFGVGLIGLKCGTAENPVNVLNDDECMLKLISRALGLGIVALGALVKLPQIIKVLAAHSSQGLSLPSLILEMTAAAVFAGHAIAIGSPFSAYGEVMLIFPQALVLALLVSYYSSARAVVTMASVSIYAAALAAIAATAPDNMLARAFLFSSPIALIAKVPQIWLNFRTKSTGNLSLITVGAYFAGTLARAFTSYRDISDRAVFYQFLAASVLNGVIFLQMMWYWNKPAAGSARNSRTQGHGKTLKKE